MEKDPGIYLRHILEAIANIEADTAGYDFAKFRVDRRARQLVERNLEILSEASRRLPKELKEGEAHVPWRAIAGIGNVPPPRLPRNVSGHPVGDLPKGSEDAQRGRQPHCPASQHSPSQETEESLTRFGPWRAHGQSTHTGAEVPRSNAAASSPSNWVP
jgi:hypothetical protein